MNARKAVAVAVAIGVAWLPATARGAGYSIYEQGAAVLGMAGAGVAWGNDASAVFYNPAALTRLDGKTRASLGSTLLSPVTSFAGMAPYPGYGVTEEMEHQQFVIPSGYLAHRYGSGWATGLGFNAPYGLGVKWKNPLTFSGRYIVTRADLKAANGMAVAAYSFSPQLSAGAGADLMLAKVKLQRRQQAVAPGGGGGVVDVAEVDLSSDYDQGWGWNAALAYAPTSQWKVAGTYRSKVVVDAKGHVDFTQIPTGDPVFDANVAAGLPPDQGANTVLRFPATWTAAVAWLPTEAWTIEGDFVYFEWSVFRDLPIRFVQTPAANQTIVENYRDARQVRFGAEHRLARYTYRLGYYYDQAAAPDPSVSPILPDAPRHGATLGAGFGLGKDRAWTLDLYELALFVKKRSTNGVERDGYDGEYKSFVNAFGASLGYRW